MATLADLPDSVLLEIFSYLPVRDRIRISRVCHRWKRLVDDRWLWRHVDLTLYTVRGADGAGLGRGRVSGPLAPPPRSLDFELGSPGRIPAPSLT
uniref:F-box domain-containing protein n=1 Tax=Ursus americanus TaxID=9643 RepID=A0A452RWL7_URSAM